MIPGGKAHNEILLGPADQADQKEALLAGFRRPGKEQAGIAVPIEGDPGELVDRLTTHYNAEKLKEATTA